MKRESLDHSAILCEAVILAGLMGLLYAWCLVGDGWARLKAAWSR